MGVPWEVQAERWEGGMVRFGSDWRERGLSMKVATRPEAMCHSMWQWKSQTRGGEGVSCGFGGFEGVLGGNLSGLSARNLRTMLPFGRTVNVSRLIGTAGKVSLPT